MAKSLNRVILIGHLGRDAEQRFTPSGAAVANVSMATSRRFKKGDEWVDETDWHNIVIWNGENLAQYLTKGKQVAVEGYLKTRSWEKDSVKHYSTEVICWASDVVLLGGGGGRPTPGDDEAPQRRTRGDGAKAPAKQEQSAGQQEIDEDVPF